MLTSPIRLNLGAETSGKLRGASKKTPFNIQEIKAHSVLVKWPIECVCVCVYLSALKHSIIALIQLRTTLTTEREIRDNSRDL